MPFDSTGRAIAYTEERFSDLREEGAGLFALHWFESAADRGVPLEVWWDYYRTMEAAGLMLTVVARSAGRMIGYAVYAIGPHPHYKSLIVGHSDCYFADPSYAKGWVGINLFRDAERRLAARGVHVVTANVKLHVKRGRLGTRTLERLFRWMGYRPIEIVLHKRIG